MHVAGQNRRLEKVDLARELEQIEGWLYLEEAWALHEAVQDFPDEGRPLTVVEIGSWKGRSTVALASAIRARGDGKVFAIDPHTGTSDGPEPGPVSTASEFLANVRAAGLQPFVELIQTTAHEARLGFASRSVDVLFVDGSHHYDDVKTDILDWQTALRDHSTVAFNDPSVPGVYEALRELVVLYGSCFKRPALIQNTLFFNFRRNQSWTRHDTIALARLRFALALRFQANRVRPYLPKWLVWVGHRVSRGLVGR